MYRSDPDGLTAFTRGGVSSTVRVAMIAVFTALTTVATVIVSIPFPTSSGYLNFGDALVMLSGFLLGPTGGFIAGGFGSAMGDVSLGYTQYAPITFLVKGSEGAVVGLFCTKTTTATSSTGKMTRVFPASAGFRVTDLLGLILAAITMMIGYFLFEVPLYGLSAAVAEMATVNWIQVSVGVIVALILGPSLRHYLSTQMPAEVPEETMVTEPASGTSGS